MKEGERFLTFEKTNFARADFFNSLVADWRTCLRHIEVKPLPETNSLQVSKHFGIKKIEKKIILTFQNRK